MAIPYLIPAGEAPDKAYEALYEKQDDESYLLQIDDLPEAQEAPATAPDAPDAPDNPPDNSPADSPADSPDNSLACHGAGVQAAPLASQGAGAGQTILSPHDSEAIQSSLQALATGRVRLGT